MQAEHKNTATKTNMTITQLKKDLQVGTKVTCIGREEDSGPGTPLKVVPLKEELQGIRTVTHVDTTGLYMSKDTTRGSFLGWPKKRELERNGNSFNVLFTRKDGSVWAKMYYVIEK